jgi:hypothetical protein
MADRIREGVRGSDAKRADFHALRASVLVVAQDLAESFTLRFDHGRLTIHDGNVGIPSVTFCGDAAALRRLEDFPLTRRFRLPLVGPLTRAGRDTWLHLAGLMLRGELKVYGLSAHPRTVFHLIRLLSAHG